MHFAPRHVLVPVALEEGSEPVFAHETIEAACDLARNYKAKVSLLYVAPSAIPLPETPHDFTGQTYQAMVSLLSARVTQARRALDELAHAAQSVGVDAEGVVVTDAVPIAEAICQAAVRMQADLIAISTHGRRGLRHLVLGSVAEKIAQLSTVPVLVLHPTQHAVGTASTAA
jgi:nucleotide-binding universal stress UspA family protein